MNKIVKIVLINILITVILTFLAGTIFATYSISTEFGGSNGYYDHGTEAFLSVVFYLVFFLWFYIKYPNAFYFIFITVALIQAIIFFFRKYSFIHRNKEKTDEDVFCEKIEL